MFTEVPHAAGARAVHSEGRVRALGSLPVRPFPFCVLGASRAVNSLFVSADALGTPRKESPPPMICPSCQRRHLVVIHMRVGDEPVTLRTCSYCDGRWWESLDGRLSLNAVLDLAAQA
jgi:hypothetical protein